MDKIQLLNERKAALESAGASIREDIRSLVDEQSFVELSAFSFSKNFFYGEDIPCEGVVTGFATIDGYPFYLVAQDFAQLSGGLSKANCEKIARALNAAEKNDTPVVYLLHTHGVQVGEGVNVLEGIAELMLKVTQLKGSVMQYAVINGEVYGSAAILAATCDCVIFTKDSAFCTTSPFVLSAKEGKNAKPTEIGGASALSHTGLPAIEVADVKEASEVIKKMNALLSVPVVDAELNAGVPALDEACDAFALAALLEEGIEIGKYTSPEVRTILGRVGGITVAAVVFDESVALNSLNMRKIRNFTEFACYYSLPFVTFVNCVGIENTAAVNDSTVLKEISEYLSILDATDTAKIAVVTGKAIGLGYSLFAAKSVGFDYTFAFCNAQIALFDAGMGAEIVLDASKQGKEEEFERLYAEENSDPVHAAKGGYLDCIIRPQFVKQYLIQALQMLGK